MILTLFFYSNDKTIHIIARNLIGKILEDTPNPYHRVDTVKYKGFTKSENRQVRCSAGLAVLFKTNSTTISVKTEYGWQYSSVNTMGIATRGYDLYMKDGDQWLWAASGATRPEKGSDNLVLIKNMDGSEKECMLYLPIYCELYSVKIGVQEGADIQALESPFNYRIGIFGSSFTHGISTSRPGMSYPMQHEPSRHELHRVAHAQDRPSVPQHRLQRQLQDAAILCGCPLRCRRGCPRLRLVLQS